MRKGIGNFGEFRPASCVITRTSTVPLRTELPVKTTLSSVGERRVDRTETRRLNHGECFSNQTCVANVEIASFQN